LGETGHDAKTGECILRVEPRYFRPAEVDTLLGDAAKARAKLGWKPEVGFDELVREMAERDLRLAEREKLLAERQMARGNIA
jgi:GDPmannose 4,6-dehydratase